jgi:hypothetical protein
VLRDYFSELPSVASDDTRTDPCQVVVDTPGQEDPQVGLGVPPGGIAVSAKTNDLEAA